MTMSYEKQNNNHSNSWMAIIQGCEDNFLTIIPFEAEGTAIDFHSESTSDRLHVAVLSIKCSEYKGDV